MNHNANSWIAPEKRTREQMELTEAFHDRIGKVPIGAPLADIPERFIWAEQEIKHLGKPLPRCHQKTGSCVGAGSWVALQKSMLGDMVFREDSDAIKPHFPWAPYGKGRAIGGMNRPGEGSFGGAQAEAVDDDVFGLLPYDDPRFPQPNIKDEIWWHWTASQEKKWSHPSAWPVPERELADEGKQFGCKDIVRVKSVEQVKQLTAQGYGITVASMFGTRPKLEGTGENKVLLGRWNDRWAHQQSVGGYWEHPQFGLLILVDNQWTKNAYNGLNCPVLAQFRSNGSVWELGEDFDRQCRNDEVYAHASGGFPSRQIKWDDFGFVFSD